METGELEGETNINQILYCYRSAYNKALSPLTNKCRISKNNLSLKTSELELFVCSYEDFLIFFYEHEIVGKL